MKGPTPRGPLTTALVAMLAEATERPIGDGAVPPPADGEKAPRLPYAVVYALDGGEFYGPPFSAPEADADHVYQVTSVGETREQVEAMADRVRTAILGREDDSSFTTPLAVAGMVVAYRRSDGGSGGVDRVGDLLNIAERFVISTTPA